MAADASVRRKIVIGLADQQAGDEVANVVRHTTGTTNALTVGATTLRLGVAGGTVAFFGGTGSTRATSAAVTDFASLKTALQVYGLIGT
jgi:hypothetical protein